ncbi:hypothetical protein, conserved [Eimeria tenella]|uniref:Articulin family protein, related n=1 Tax=Eimeria tenella TaxID=5802 RepID=U6L5G9_EIMTE|nr:hypothetical protein, conserved [Eimeria tenella]CDJ43025.1 hypothetical protein, conserved [Eimeria tenella]|eukprot:XP_013233775.1 hypothetical protein, conserved [Eimeria tenella]
MSQEASGCGTVPFCGSLTCDAVSCEAEQVQRAHIRLQADQPVVPVPVYQEIQKRDKYIEVPQVEVKDSIVPKVYNQSAVHDVPKVHVECGERNVAIESEKIVEREVDVPIHVGYAPQFVPKWDIREVPRPVPKYEGEQQIIEVEVPQIEYKDTYVEKEVVVDIKEKIVPKVTEVVKEVEVMQYEWKEKYQDVPVYKYVPKFDVELDCPPPLIVPYTETRYVQDEPETSNPYCGWSACCTKVHQEPHIKTVETAVRSEQQRLYPGSAHLSEANVKYPGNQDFSAHFQKNTEERVLRGSSVVDGPVRQATLSQLTPGPVFPRPTPQVGASEKSKSSGARLNDKKPSFWSWLTGKKEEPETPTQVSKFGYPENMPSDFAAAFQNQGSAVAGEPQPNPTELGGVPEEKEKQSDELEPTVVYRGAVNKPPEYGGELDPISFKLHAIEIHQFVPLPNMEAPEFVKALSNGIMTSDVSGLEKFFGGHVPPGWADPDVTGIPATTMSDILSGNAQNVAVMSPLVCQLSSQFAKQGFVPGGTQEMTQVGSFKRNTSQPQPQS